MVVHRVYKNTKELTSMFETDLGLFDSEDDDFAEDMMNDFISDEELEKEIFSLGEIERKMVKEEEGEDEEAAPMEGDDDQKPSAIDPSPKLQRADRVGNSQHEDNLGKSEEAAITLSSEESDSESVQPSAAPVATVRAPPASSPMDAPLTNCRMYRMVFPGPSIGVDISSFHGRVVVDNVGPERRQRLGQNCKPATGDVFVSIHNVQCPFGWSLAAFQHYMKAVFTKPPVTVTFAEVPQYRDQFLRYREQRKRLPRLPPSGPSEVIEIDDSDG